MYLTNTVFAWIHIWIVISIRCVHIHIHYSSIIDAQPYIYAKHNCICMLYLEICNLTEEVI
jgi:hypothetical protein